MTMSELNQTGTKNKPGKNKIRIAAGVGLVAVLGGVGLAKINNLSDNASRKHFDTVEAMAIGEAQTAKNNVFAVRSGAEFHSAPIMTADASKGEGPSTIVDSVPKGMVLRIDRPIDFRDDEGNHWLGFTIANKDPKPNSASTKDIYWVNASNQPAQSDGQVPYVIKLNYSKENTAISPADIPISITSDNTFATNTKAPLPIASGQIIPEGVFDQQLSRDGLAIS